MKLSDILNEGPFGIGTKAPLAIKKIAQQAVGHAGAVETKNLLKEIKLAERLFKDFKIFLHDYGKRPIDATRKDLTRFLQSLDLPTGAVSKFTPGDIKSLKMVFRRAGRKAAEPHTRPTPSKHSGLVGAASRVVNYLDTK